MSKHRLSASVDSHLIEAVESAVAQGRSDSISSWVNEALRLKLENDRRLEALAAFLRTYEKQYGEITAEEMSLASRRARANAVTVRSGFPPKLTTKRQRRKTR